MKLERIQGKWTQIFGNALEQWAKPRHDGTGAFTGQRGQIAGKIQEQVDIAKDEAKGPDGRGALLGEAFVAHNAQEPHLMRVSH